MSDKSEAERYQQTMLAVIKREGSILVDSQGTHYSLPLSYRDDPVLSKQLKRLFTELSINNLNLYLNLNRFTEDDEIDAITQNFMQYVSDVQQAVDEPSMFIEPSYQFDKYDIKIAHAYVSANNFDENTLKAIAHALTKPWTEHVKQ